RSRFVREMMSGEKTDDLFLQGYDGQVTRVVEGAIANVRQGRFEGCKLYKHAFPHNWLLDRAFPCFPLSMWLRGGKELQNHPSAGLYKNWLQTVTFEKEEVVNDLVCVKIRASAVTPKGNTFVRFLWLARDRNYLPVKSEFFNHRLSAKLPGEVCEAGDFRELAPGIWLPFSRSIIVYDEAGLLGNRQVKGNSQTIAVSKAKLDPDRSLSLFRDIAMPEKGAIYDVAHTGEIVSGRIVSNESGANLSEFGSWNWLLIGGLCALFLGGACWFAYRRLRSRTIVVERTD
ncbi:MAG: outer membrane lipoprotein-sorting protein, partial [Acidobacteria bacterium]|nr:outer membrane lipoprotein-sorting protein [Acidobacteriota bacterium]